jgi:hypothetical protein
MKWVVDWAKSDRNGRTRRPRPESKPERKPSRREPAATVTRLDEAAPAVRPRLLRLTSSLPFLGVLQPALEHDTEVLIWKTVFVQRLQKLGWTEGRNLVIESRFGAIGSNLIPDFAKELVALRPDVILASGTASVTALRQSTFSIPIVFTQVPDPVEVGLVVSFARPGGNITGFTNFEPTIAGKWLQALKDLSPGISRVAIIFDPDNPSWVVYVRALEAAAQTLGARLTPAGVRDAADIGRTMESFAREGGAGLVVLPGPVTLKNRDDIINIGSPLPVAHRISVRLLHRRGWPLVLRCRSRRPVPARGDLRRPHSPRREGRRSPGTGAYQIRIDD